MLGKSIRTNWPRWRTISCTKYKKYKKEYERKYKWSLNSVVDQQEGGRERRGGDERVQPALSSRHSQSGTRYTI